MLISGLNTVGGAPAFSATVGFQAGFKLPSSLSNGLNEYLAHTYRHRMVRRPSTKTLLHWRHSLLLLLMRS